ncbi:hypothetical protein E2P81_ATG02433 [Venturia nashicola]|uniref:Uncharacterized protein n=1 Tax=Venturia nashicola TaxID=86259 RepID=A0A4Z1P5A1_9PEZI|nr:hypothetical protein E6O75_ATG02492 [Venturia nashicola]TLD36651.1 hypothetical protein E2P81_ATG02433 [Venturia nashicola]
MAAGVGSSIFFSFSLLVISLLVLLLLRYYLPIRSTPGYLLLPVFLSLSLPSSIILLVPIDLASNAGTGEARGIWLPDRALLVAWRITYWLTFILTWFALPLLGEYSDSGYRDPKDRFIYSLRSNARYQLTVLSIGSVGAVYFFLTEGFNFMSLKGLVMALAYAWGLILAIYLMGHGLVSIPKRLYHDANPSRRLRRLQAQAPRIHDKLLEATDDLGQYEQQVFQLKQRKNGTAAVYKEWIDELDDMATVPEARIMASVASARLPSSLPPIPHVITDRYLADLTRKLKRARHKKIRYLSEWEHLIMTASRQQTILDSFSSKKLDFGKASPYASLFEKMTLLTPYTRYLVHSAVVPAIYYFTSGIAALSSVCIIWSEIVKGFASSKLSLIGLTVVHHRDDSRGLIGFAGQCLAAFWLCYMCTCALWSVTEVKVWGNRALVRRGTYEESACWYAGQVAKLTVPLSYNFVTMMPGSISEATMFHKFLGKLVELTPLGKGFSGFYPILVLLPVVASMFGLYGKIKSATGFGDVIGDEEGLGGWREGKALIEREVRGQPGAVGLSHRAEGDSRDGSFDIPRESRTGAIAASSAATRNAARPVRAEYQRVTQPEEEEEEGNFVTDFAHRVANTFSAADKPAWLSEGFKKPAWMGGEEGNTTGGADSSDGGLSRWFGRGNSVRL